MIWRAQKAEGRIAAKNASKIRAALGQQIDPMKVYEGYQETQPIKTDNLSRDRSRARSWAMLNVNLDMDAVYTALVRLWTEAYVLGQLAAREAIQQAIELKKAGDTDYIDWDNWQPGDEVAAALVNPPGALERLLNAGKARIKGLEKETYNEIGSALGESIALGLSGKQAARLIQNNVQSASRALTIAITETCRVRSLASMETYKEFGLEQHEWLPINPCDICALNDGAVVNIGSPFPSGVIQPPQHPNCKCAVMPVIPDMSETPNENGVIDIAPESESTPMFTTGEDILDRMTYQRDQGFTSTTVPVPQERALYSYVENDYLNMQSVSRTGKVGLGSNTPEHIAEIAKKNDELAALISSAPPLPSDLVTYRGVQGDIARSFLEAKPGDILRDKGFSSTSLLREKAEIYIDRPLPGFSKVSSDTAIIEVISPAGSRGVMVEGFFSDINASDTMITDFLGTAFTTKTQYEWLLNRGASFEVISIKGTTITVRLR
jgi:hypothetical protein